MRKYIAFLKVIECGSFTIAADELNYTQSAISQMISSLEKELKVTLFIRSKHGLQLTYEGTQILPFIRELVNAHNSLNEKCMALNELQTGIVRIATFSTFLSAVLSRALREFKEDYPNIVFEFHQGYYREIEHWVSKDIVDFGVTNIDGLKNYQTIKLFDDPLFAILPSKHKFSSEKVIPVRYLKDESFVVLDEGDDKDFANMLRSINIEPNIKYRLGDETSILSMVENGLGIAMLPKLAMLVGHFDVVNLPIEPEISRPIGVIYKDKNHLSSPSQVFINYIIENIERYLKN